MPTEPAQKKYLSLSTVAILKGVVPCVECAEVRGAGSRNEDCRQQPPPTDYVTCRVVHLRCFYNANEKSNSTKWPIVMVWPWKAGNYPQNRQLVRFGIVWMAFCIRDNHDIGRARARTVRCHNDSGNNRAASLLLLRFKKASSAKD